ncbi:MAG TPA: transcription-repair coupling factor [Brevefilum fermentans]|jgi:transcription-repair coupling factor (superfamily II helicase)|nr:transcription-repair coupling factor [Brevefilum fermentans]
MQLLDAIGELTAYRELLSDLQGAPGRSQTLPGLGLPRAARLPLLARLQHDLACPILLITNRADRALALYEELGFWLGEAGVHYFPEPNPLFYEKSGWGAGTRRDRLQVLTLLARLLIPGMPQPGHPPVIVAPVRAIMTRTLPRRDFIKHTRALRIGQQVTPDGLTREWVETGYDYANIVVEAGQFSRRGGILDVWSPGEDEPARIEFFGDEIDTMRTFDPATQRTLANLEALTVTPAREILPRAAEKAGLPLKDLSEFLLPLAHPMGGCLLDFLPDNALIALDGQEFIAAAVTEIEEESLSRRDDAIRAGEIDADFPLPFFTWSEIEDRVGKRPLVELGYTGALDEPALAANFLSGPRFAGKLRDFMDHLKALQREGQPWVVVSRQSARLRNLWRDGLLAQDARAEQQLESQFIEGNLAGGWSLTTRDGGMLHLLTDSEIFGWARPQPRRRYRPTAEAPESSYADLEPGDWVVHVDYGIGKFAGLVQRTHEGTLQEYLCIEFADQDHLFVPIHHADRLTRYIGADGHVPVISRLGGSTWSATKQKVREAVQEIAGELLDLYAQRQVAEGFSFSQDTPWQRELEASFPYIETEDQLQALAEIKADMENPRPMDRLLCGDVGYGKTEVTLRAAFKAVMDGKQVAVLVPTTVLAQQHYDTFRERLATFPVEVEMLSRFRTQREQNRIIKDLSTNKVDIVIGTHRLLSGDVSFKNLGLVVIDEEQRFGVAHKEHLKKLRTSVDVLTLTATPIPRTLYMALTGVRDISTINSPPEERLPIVTHIGPYDSKLVRYAIVRELERGGQVFFVHNRVQTINAMKARLEKLVPEASIAIAHGQMDENELAATMHRFTDGEVDVLLCTSIIEAGLDIPNANTLIVDRADTLGLAQLYQLRGRVGRGAQRAYAYLFRHRLRAPTPEGQERLEVLAENTQLGSGYAIAMRDLEMRGAGELLGTRQSGYIASVGFHLYTRLLAQAVNQYRLATGAKGPGDASVLDAALTIPTSVNLPLSIGIPDTYIPDKALRLKLYRRLADIHDEAALASIEMEFVDRFGPPPERVSNLLFQIKIKVLAAKAGLAAVSFEGRQILLRYPPLPSGIENRNLPELGYPVSSGKNAYRIHFHDPENEPWQELLVQTLVRIARADGR